MAAARYTSRLATTTTPVGVRPPSICTTTSLAVCTSSLVVTATPTHGSSSSSTRQLSVSSGGGGGGSGNGLAARTRRAPRSGGQREAVTLDSRGGAAPPEVVVSNLARSGDYAGVIETLKSAHIEELSSVAASAAAVLGRSGAVSVVDEVVRVLDKAVKSTGGVAVPQTSTASTTSMSGGGVGRGRAQVRSPISLNAANAVTAAYVRSGSWQKAQEFVSSRLPAWGLRPDTVTYNTLIANAPPYPARRLLNEMISQEIAPDSVTYNSLAQSHARRGQLGAGLAVVDEIEAVGLIPDVVTYATLLVGAGQQGEGEQARGGRARGGNTDSSQQRQYSSGQADTRSNNSPGGGSSEVGGSNTTSRNRSGSGSASRERGLGGRLAKLAKQAGLVGSDKGPAGTASGRGGGVQKPQSQPQSQPQSARLSVEELESLYDVYDDGDVSDSRDGGGDSGDRGEGESDSEASAERVAAVAAEAVAAAVRELSPVSRAVLRRMADSGVVPDATVFNVIAGQHAQARRHESVEATLAAAAAIGLPVGSATYAALVRGYYRAGDATGVVDSVRRMRGAGLPLDTRTYNTLLNTFADGATVAGADYVVSAMDRSRAKADRFTYEAVVRVLVNSGSVLKAHELLHSIAARGLRPTHASVEAVLRGFVGARLYGEAQQMFNHMEERLGVVPSIAHYRVLFELYDRSNLPAVVLLGRKLLSEAAARSSSSDGGGGSGVTHVPEDLVALIERAEADIRASLPSLAAFVCP